MMQPFTEFLAERGLTDGSPEQELEVARTEYRREYQRDYQRTRRNTRWRIELQLSKGEYERISHEAQNHGMRRARFAREAALAYLEGRYLLPDPSVVRDLELAIRRIGGNVNQLVRYSHTNQSVGADVVQELQMLLRELEDVVTGALRHPQKENG